MKVNGKDDIPYIKRKIIQPCLKPPTSQKMAKFLELLCVMRKRAVNFRRTAGFSSSNHQGLFTAHGSRPEGVLCPGSAGKFWAGVQSKCLGSIPLHRLPIVSNSKLSLVFLYLSNVSIAIVKHPQFLTESVV